MLLIASYFLIVLGSLHVLFGLVRFRSSLGEIVREGVLGRFEHSDSRRLSFWFIMAGPLLSVLGLAAQDAVLDGDLLLIGTMGLILLIVAAIGVAAFPKSPLWALWPPALIFTASGFGLAS